MAQGASGNKVALIGAGHMGSALVKGLLLGGMKRSDILVSDRADRNAAIAKKAKFIFLAVKPAVVPEVVKGIRSAAEGKTIISVAATVKLSQLQKMLGKRAHIARIMPNLPVANGQGVVGFLPGTISGSERRTISRLLGTLGLVITVRTEKELDAITLVSGCGPGLVSYFVTLFAKQAKRLGIRNAAAEAIAFATFAGALAYAREERVAPETLMRAVATPGGVTEAILNGFETRGLSAAFRRALQEGERRLKK
jgi:pyrroline-5-carboxylate reductase